MAITLALIVVALLVLIPLVALAAYRLMRNRSRTTGTKYFWGEH